MIVSAKTDTGKVRKENQDAYKTGTLSDCLFAVVCDGMGGVAGGAVASDTAVSVFSSALTEAYSVNGTRRSLKSMLTVCADRANTAVYDMSVEREDLHGMGTTIVAAVLESDRLSVVHAGDSRAYLLRDGELSRLTRDHSMVQTLIDDGYINEEQAQHHMYKNLITRALGTEPQIKVDFCEYEIQPEDTVLLCTDGLTNFVEKNQMLDILQTYGPDDAAEMLVDAANENGGGDNITVVIMKNS